MSKPMIGPPGPRIALLIFVAVSFLYAFYILSGTGEELYEWSKTFAPYSVRRYLGMSKRYLLQYGHIVFLFLLLVLSQPIFRSQKSLPTTGRVVKFVTKYSTAIFLFHFPIMFFFAAVTSYDRTNLLHQILLLVATVGSCLAMGWFCFLLKPVFDAWQKHLTEIAEKRFPRPKSVMQGAAPISITISHSEFLNLVKVISMVCVVLGHYSFDRLTTISIPGFNGAAPRFAVPTFFLISGYFLMMSIDRHKLGAAAMIFRRGFSLYYIVVPMLVLTVILDNFGFRADAALYDYSEYYINEELRDPYTVNQILAASVSSLLYLNESWIFTWLAIDSEHGGMRAFSNDSFWFMCYLMTFSIALIVGRLTTGFARSLLLFLCFAFFGIPILLLAPLFFAGVLAYVIHKKWSHQIATNS